MQGWELSEPPTNPIMSRCRGRHQPTLPPFSFSSTCSEDYRKLGSTHACCQLYG